MNGVDVEAELADLRDRLVQEPGSRNELWVRPGWHVLVAELNHQLREIDPDVPVRQVKEKLGRLRVYLGASEKADELEAAVLAAEARSVTVCDLCGAPGQLHQDGIYRTRCDLHAGGPEAVALIAVHNATFR